MVVRNGDKVCPVPNFFKSKLYKYVNVYARSGVIHINYGEVCG